jgi:hypothetical protein
LRRSKQIIVLAHCLKLKIQRLKKEWVRFRSKNVFLLLEEPQMKKQKAKTEIVWDGSMF